MAKWKVKIAVPIERLFAMIARNQICTFQFAFFNLHCLLSLLLALLFALLERLRETKLNLTLVQPVDRGERRIGVQSLRDQKLRRVRKLSALTPPSGPRTAPSRRPRTPTAPPHPTPHSPRHPIH